MTVFLFRHILRNHGNILGKQTAKGQACDAAAKSREHCGGKAGSEEKQRDFPDIYRCRGEEENNAGQGY